MKDLYEVMNECKRDIESLGIELGEVCKLSVNKRAQTRWGLCRGCKGVYEISISSRLLDDEVDDMALKNTMAHELLHTIKGGNGHKGEWKRCAELMNRTYGYNIKRCTSADEKGVLSSNREKKIKYILECSNCGQKYDYIRKTKVINAFLYNGKEAKVRYRCGVCKKNALDLL